MIPSLPMRQPSTIEPRCPEIASTTLRVRRRIILVTNSVISGRIQNLSEKCHGKINYTVPRGALNEKAVGGYGRQFANF